ncbi:MULTISPECIES: SurA N-terminal domain-containing protein [Variovorax]|jgi:peptidyl-prolyl cis-trans isomerase D|uniref:SurA N-terminal domain-containing protein n=1 Tax=Variovorax TaxID=34072 RepID=UPI00086D4230|nr:MULTISPECIES: SurA N-terminal domain-containing protein [Variovorax]MBN8753484.1 SurA N-terminal domain-containing protein [Variovorax sp.]ODU15766.1 MAG: peptidylprolyl isomerase [Variovorax sp. SCN 67-85]ODV27559.1 MAG: peptidylprolyl isomerase [Variovorax sp. SCN 67-20]OJZ11445.1 MAG: peptidylprolyl isomerase [Variovorax sp. 67-131]UKI05910.1 SurA N-terminal domain-containing protein [Variovorax paradoxus]
MFEAFRKHTKIVMIFLFLLIIPSFVFFGVERYQGFGGDEKVARIEGHDITRPEWDQQHRVETDRIRQQSPNVDPTLLESDALRYATLERMVRDRVLAAAAAKANMTVSEDRLSRIFAQDPGLASFRTPDGKFDRETFQRVTGRTPEQYEASVRADMATQQVMLGISGTAFTSPALAATTINAFYDSREIQVARFNPETFASKVTVSDADIEAYYKDHASQFQAPEQANIEYLVLDLDAAKKNISVNEDDLKTYYKENAARFGTKEERRASHILITAPSSMPAADREKAKAKAEALLAEVKKAPNTFADVARKNSQDPGSAEKGGDLDFVTRGAMVKPFEDAMFALKKGEISNVIETEFGYHIIHLTDIKPAVVPPFEQVRATIESDVRSQQATQEFAKAAEAFTDAVYQTPDSLKPAADKLKLTIQTANNVARTPVPGATGPLASRNFLNALFAPDSLQRKQNTEAIEVGANQLASGRVTTYAPAHPVPLAEVKDKIRAQLINERAAVLAKTEGEAKLAAWTTKADGATFGAPMTVSRRDAASQPLPVIDAALRADAAKLPTLVGVDLGAQGYAVVRVTKVVPRTPPPAELAKQEQTQVGQSVAAAEDAAYYNMLKDRYKAQILVPKPADPLPGAAAAGR